MTASGWFACYGKMLHLGLCAVLWARRSPWKRRWFRWYFKCHDESTVFTPDRYGRVNKRTLSERTLRVKLLNGDRMSCNTYIIRIVKYIFSCHALLQSRNAYYRVDQTDYRYYLLLGFNQIWNYIIFYYIYRQKNKKNFFTK